MASKLTLIIDEGVIEAAKDYAAATGTTLSRLVEDYLRAIAPHAERSKAPILGRLRGSMRNADVDDHREHLTKKHR